MIISSNLQFYDAAVPKFIVLLSMHAFDCAHTILPSGNLEGIDLSKHPREVPLKITNRGNLLRSIAKLTASDDPSIMIENCLFSFG